MDFFSEINPKNKIGNYGLAIIVPIFNEANNMKAFAVKLSEFVAISLLKTCILFVDDGSTDKSSEHIEAICSSQQYFYHINLAKNSGLSAALKAGIDATLNNFFYKPN